MLKRAVLAVLALGLAACGGGGGGSAPTSPGAVTLDVADLVVGTGATAASGDTLTVHYVGTLTNGTVFDSSRASNQPFTFRLGVGQVIQGWDLGVPGMKVGGKRKLTIPPQLAYGSRQVGSIPPNSTLIFEIELLSIAGK